MDTLPVPGSFRGLLLRHSRRTGLIQRDLAARARGSSCSVQDWRAGEVNRDASSADFGRMHVFTTQTALCVFESIGLDLGVEIQVHP